MAFQKLMYLEKFLHKITMLLVQEYACFSAVTVSDNYIPAFSSCFNGQFIASQRMPQYF